MRFYFEDGKWHKGERPRLTIKGSMAEHPYWWITGVMLFGAWYFLFGVPWISNIFAKELNVSWHY